MYQPANPSPFRLVSTASLSKDIILKTRSVTGAGDSINTTKFGTMTLGKSISAGGEGTIYQLAGNKEYVCKIYHHDKLTMHRKQKIELMLSKEILFNGICWPVDVALNKQGEFIGYIMPMAAGRPMQTCMFIKPILLKNFPRWNRGDLVKIASSFLDKMAFLHSMNIIVGDINPLNVLVEESGKIWFVDTDSYQIENFSCTVGTVNYTAPEIQGKDYASFMRTKEHELFAVATMLFMILLPGKPPYSQQGGESQSDNIKKQNFSYWCDSRPETSAPEGPWILIWANFTRKIKEAFCSTFKLNKRLSIIEWQGVLNGYLWAINKGYNSNELFPMSMKIKDPIQADCGNCGATTTASRQWVEKMSNQGKDFICGDCLKRFKLEKLAKTSQQNKATISIPASVSSYKTLYRGGNKPQASGGMYYKNNSSTYQSHRKRKTSLGAKVFWFISDTFDLIKRLVSMIFRIIGKLLAIAVVVYFVAIIFSILIKH